MLNRTFVLKLKQISIPQNFEKRKKNILDALELKINKYFVIFFVYVLPKFWNFIFIFSFNCGHPNHENLIFYVGVISKTHLWA